MTRIDEQPDRALTKSAGDGLVEDVGVQCDLHVVAPVAPVPSAADTADPVKESPGPLSDDVKVFIVQKLALYFTPSEVAAAVKGKFGLQINRQRVESYNPLRAGPKPATMWTDLFHATRQLWLDERARVAVAGHTHRLEILEDLIQEARRRKDLPLAAMLLKQAAKECGYNSAAVPTSVGDRRGEISQSEEERHPR